MLHIILTILKILGFILLGILALLLAVLLFVLLVPFRYEVSGNYYDTPEADAKVSWLLGALKVAAEFKNKQLRARVSFLWFNLFDTQKASESPKEISLESSVFPEGDLSDIGFEDAFSEDEKQTEHTKPSEMLDSKPHLPEREADKPIELKEKTENIEPVQKSEKKKLTLKKEKTTNPKKEKISIGERVGALIEKIEAKIENVQQKLDDFSVKKDKIEKFIEAECTKNSLLFIKKVLWSVIRHIRPKKISGRLHFGLGKPSDTGKVLGYASMFYSLYGDSIALQPDFEKSIIEGDLRIKGSIQLYIFVYWGLRALLNKNIRSLIKYIKHIKG